MLLVRTVFANITSKTEFKPTNPGDTPHPHTSPSAMSRFSNDNDRFQAFLIKKPDPPFEHAKEMGKKMREWDKTWEKLGGQNSH